MPLMMLIHHDYRSFLPKIKQSPNPKSHEAVFCPAFQLRIGSYTYSYISVMRIILYHPSLILTFYRGIDWMVINVGESRRIR